MTFREKKNRLSRMLNAADKGITRTFGANGVLSRLFRQMLLDLRITGPRFGSLMQEYILDPRNGVPVNKKDQTSMRGNLTKEFSREQMTWKVFCKAMRFLQFTKIVFVIEAHHRNGKKTLHSTEVNLGGANDLAEFEEQLNQLPEAEHPGEHIPVLDHAVDMSAEEKLLGESAVQAIAQDSPTSEAPANNESDSMKASRK